MLNFVSNSSTLTHPIYRSRKGLTFESWVCCLTSYLGSKVRFFLSWLGLLMFLLGFFFSFSCDNLLMLTWFEFLLDYSFCYQMSSFYPVYQRNISLAVLMSVYYLFKPNLSYMSSITRASWLSFSARSNLWNILQCDWIFMPHALNNVFNAGSHFEEWLELDSNSFRQNQTNWVKRRATCL